MSPKLPLLGNKNTSYLLIKHYVVKLASTFEYLYWLNICKTNIQTLRMTNSSDLSKKPGDLQAFSLTVRYVLIHSFDELVNYCEICKKLVS